MSTYVPKNSHSVPALEVTFNDPETGELLAVEVQSNLKDRSAYEVHAHKNGWPTERPMITATFLWSGFLAWSALRRSPDAPAVLKTSTPDAFFEVVLDVMPITDEEVEEAVVSPTQPAHGHEPA